MSMENLARVIAETEERRAQDAARFAAVDNDLCMCCHAYGEDKRSLWIDCLYAVHEVVPEAIDISAVEPKPADHQDGYYLRICKSCRGRLLAMMGEWWQAGVDRRRNVQKAHDGRDEINDPERNIPVRINGAIAMLTRAEWDAREAGRT